MDFSYDQTQQSVAELARTVLRSAPDHTRAEQALASAGGYDDLLWKGMAQAGLLALAVPTAFGGDGLGAVEIAAVLTEAGRQTVPVPALATLALGVLPLAAIGGADVLREVVDGAVLTGVPVRMSLQEGRITGRVANVPYAAQARAIVVPVAAGLALVAPDAPGMTLARTPTSAGTPSYTVQFEGVAPDDLVAGDPTVVERFLVVGAAAVADGVLAAALERTAEHVRTREQFGRPLATFQAVAQEIADVYVVARTLHLAACAVAYRQSADDLDVAAYWLAAELPAALQTLHHLHGGLGVDITYPLHRWYSHGKDLARLVGGAEARLDAIGARCSSN